MHPQTESVTTCSRKDLPRFVSRKYLLLAKHVAILRQLLLRNLRQHLIDDQRNVFIASESIFGRNAVRSEKRRDVAQRRFIIQSFDSAQDFEFVFQGQAITRLGFNCRRATSQKPMCVAAASRNQIVDTCSPRVIDSGLNPTTTRSNLLVRSSLAAFFKLVHTRSRKDRMRMRIDEAWK